MTRTNIERAAAEAQAEKIRLYWLAKGEKINVWLEPYKSRESGRHVTYYAIKSDAVP